MHGGEEKWFKVLVVGPDGRRLLERPKSKRDDNTEMDLEEI